MNHFEFDWEQDDYRLYAQGWEPAEPKAILCLVHGHGEHSGRYEAFAKRLGQAGIATIALDLIGHGKSDGKRGHTPTYDFLLESVRKLIAEGEKRYFDLPMFLMGHSMGGNIVANYALIRKPDVAGVILSSPWLTLSVKPPKVKLAVAKVARKLLPTYRERTKLDANAISRIPEEVKAYQEDHLVHDYISTTLFFEVYEAGLWAIENSDKLEAHTLVTHGTADELTSMEGSKRFVEGANENCVLKLWDGGFHELHNDSDREEYLSHLIEWMEKRD